jgi:hypothetical protein
VTPLRVVVNSDARYDPAIPGTEEGGVTPSQAIVRMKVANAVANGRMRMGDTG